MQTFIPDADYAVGARTLDQKRLIKQLLEGRQIMQVLSKNEYQSNGLVTPWAHHPAVMMWRGHKGALRCYLYSIRCEMEIRGFNYARNWRVIESVDVRGEHDDPWWIADKAALDRVITSHRANLWKKDHHHYYQWGHEKAEPCCPRCNYYWPTH